jgi:sarcosine oxidase subunit gamma
MADAAITPVHGLGRLLLRGDAAAVQTAGAAFGVPIPQKACTAVFHPPRAALWLGPDEFLLLMPEPWVSQAVADIAAALGGLTHVLVDVGQRHLALALEGADAAVLLNAACPLDLDEAVFPVNACTRTLLGKVEILLWRMAPHRFHLETGRSYMPYARALLEEATLGLG